MNHIHSENLKHLQSVKDPVCKMDVIPPGKAQSHFQNENFYFCNIKCKMKFDAEPEKYLKSENKSMTAKEVSTFKTYKPLIVVFSYIFLISITVQIVLGSFDVHLLMNHIMAGFFISLSYFKFLDLKSFSEAFSYYDPIAKKNPSYGFMYPFIEIGLGLMFIAGIGLFYANILTAFILSVTTVGVIKQINTKSQFQCACLGAGFNLPLSWVTVVENAAMVFMAIYGLLT